MDIYANYCCSTKHNSHFWFVDFRHQQFKNFSKPLALQLLLASPSFLLPTSPECFSRHVLKQRHLLSAVEEDRGRNRKASKKAGCSRWAFEGWSVELKGARSLIYNTCEAFLNIAGNTHSSSVLLDFCSFAFIRKIPHKAVVLSSSI